MLLRYRPLTISTKAITCANPITMQVSNEGSIPSDEWVLDEWDLELSDEDVVRLQEIENKASNYVRPDDDPDLPTPLQDNVVPQPLKAVFFTFYQECISGNRGSHWTLHQRMPYAGKDKALDELIAQHKIDQRQASCFWHEFKGNQGVVNIKVSKPECELLSDYERRTAENAPRLFTSVIDCIEGYDFGHPTQETKDFFSSLMKSKQFEQAIMNYLSLLNRHLAKRSSGAAASQIDGRTLAFKMDCHGSALTLVPTFVESMELPESIPPYALHEWMWQVILFVNDKWTEIIVDGNHTGGSKLVTTVTDAQVDELLKGSKGTVYYVAGWLIYTCMQLWKQKPNNQANCQVVCQFLETNTIAADVAKNDELLPSTELEHREIHYGAVQRVSSQFFHFVLYMEALYVANLTVANGIRY
jgi:hypothetical protein